MNDDIFAVSDDEQSSGKPPAAEVARPKPLSIDLSGAKRKADLETEESVTDSQKRLRSTAGAINLATLPEGHPGHTRPHCKTEAQAAAAEDKGARVNMEGKQAAHLASQQLHDHTVASGLLDTAKLQDNASDSPQASLDMKAMRKAIAAGFALTDQQVLAQAHQQQWADGAVCVAVWLIHETAFVANVGDARCVLGRAVPGDMSTRASKAVVLTKEHKAIFPEERKRIEKSGGFVRDSRLQGKIEVSRSFGDMHFKKVGMSAVPNIQVFNLTAQDKFLLCGCDGFWSCFSPQDAVQAVADMLEKGKFLKAICDRLIYMAIRDKRCKDNCSVIIVRFL